MAYQNPKSDWENLGDTIEHIIDDAVSSRNYQKLNQSIRHAVDTGSEAVRRAVNNASSVNANVRDYSYMRNGMDSRRRQEYRQSLPVLYGNPNSKKVHGILQTVGGGILTFLSFLGLLAYGLVGLFGFAGGLVTAGSILNVAFLGGSVALLTRGIRKLKRLGRFETYKRLLGSKTYCEVRRLAGAVGLPEKRVQKELQGMINEGLFLEGHMDAEQTSLITSHDTYQHYQQAQLQLQQRRQAELESQQKTREAEAARQENPAQEVLSRGNAFIRQIRSCNDAIPGPEISAKISRMELIVQKIFDRAEAHPEIVPDLKKLMDYYLPMTVKLLTAYAEMDAQPVQGDTIIQSKKEIEDTLDTLNNAFEKLLDSVFKDTAMDVSSDISVLQTLLAQEGLTDDELTKMKKDM